MRRVILTIFTCAALGLVLAGCGAEGVVSPTPQTVIGSLPKAPTFPITPAFHLTGDPAAGAAIFKTSACGGCHTLAAAHATGTVGPNLDTLKPDYRHVTAQVTNGGAAMPAFKSSLSAQQIANVAAYVVKSTGGTP
ncbi:MAG TPA: c-type cytochrome [Gaiellaceae bacterium]|nr:c-type cytochrome [Gaiellaceae bacterium]